MRFENLELVKEYPEMLWGKYPFRLYQSDFGSGRYDNNLRWVRYHFGWPKFMVDPLLPLLETTLFWGNSHWCEEDDFYIYWEPSISIEGDIPFDELNRQMKYRISGYNKCLNMMKNWRGR